MIVEKSLEVAMVGKRPFFDGMLEIPQYHNFKVKTHQFKSDFVENNFPKGNFMRGIVCNR